MGKAAGPFGGLRSLAQPTLRAFLAIRLQPSPWRFARMVKFARQVLQFDFASNCVCPPERQFRGDFASKRPIFRFGTRLALSFHRSSPSRNLERFMRVSPDSNPSPGVMNRPVERIPPSRPGLPHTGRLLPPAGGPFFSPFRISISPTSCRLLRRTTCGVVQFLCGVPGTMRNLAILGVAFWDEWRQKMSDFFHKTYVSDSWRVVRDRYSQAFRDFADTLTRS